ncbi:MAG: ABC transporter substrate-binding protein [Desulfobacteraceae bacterium]|nr:ABC transporter substrate-binding protein [Desulfobacteraceae bacterium]
MNRKRCMMVFVVLFLIFAQTAGASELVIGTMSEPSMDPHYLYLTTNIAYAKHIFGRLAGLDENIRLTPDLALSWKTSDNLSWEFKLRQGVKFHDGSEFTAEDVVFSFSRVSNVPNNPASYINNLRGIAETSIVDPYTLMIRTDKPNPILPIQLHNIAIVSQKAAGKAGTDDFKSGKAAIGTGPYKFVEYIPGNRLVLQRNENYWGEKPAFEKVTFRIFSNDETRTAALLGGTVDMIDFAPPFALEQLEKKNFKLFKCASDRIIFMACNTIKDSSPYITGKDGKPLAKNPLQDIRVRKALSQAIYRDALIQMVMKGLAFPASQLIPDGWYSHNPDLKVEKYDPDNARKLLAEAGYPDGFGLTIHGPNDRYVNDAKVCDAVAQMLAKIGLKTKVETMSKSEYFGKLSPPKNEFAFCLQGWGNASAGESSQGLMALAHSYDKTKGTGSYNPGYSDAKADAAIEKAVATTDKDAREKMLREAMATVINDYAIIPLYAQSVVVASKKGIVYIPRSDEQTLAMNARPE